MPKSIIAALVIIFFLLYRLKDWFNLFRNKILLTTLKYKYLDRLNKNKFHSLFCLIE